MFKLSCGVPLSLEIGINLCYFFFLTLYCQVFYGILLQYFAVLANMKPLNFKLLNLLVKPLMEMSAEVPYFAAICARQRLLHTRTQFTLDVKDTGPDVI